MKTIAVTYWNTIVSPLYDASCNLLIVRPGGERDITDIRDLSLYDRSDFCMIEGIDVLICGAISSLAHTILTNRNIIVVPWICGPVDEVVEAYRNGTDLNERYSMPGCGRKKCERHRHRRRYGGI